MDTAEITRTYIGLLLATVFIAAGIAKLANRNQFRSTLSSLTFIPSWSRRSVSLTVPLTEITVGTLLLSGWRWARFVGLGAGLAMLLLFLGLSIWIATQVTENTDCSCFGPLAPGTFGWGTVIRNAVLTFFAALVVVLNGIGDKRNLYDAELNTVAFSSLLVVVTIVIYIIGTSVWANRAIFPMLSE